MKRVEFVNKNITSCVLIYLIFFLLYNCFLRRVFLLFQVFCWTSASLLLLAVHISWQSELGHSFGEKWGCVWLIDTLHGEPVSLNSCFTFTLNTWIMVWNLYYVELYVKSCIVTTWFGLSRNRLVLPYSLLHFTRLLWQLCQHMKHYSYLTFEKSYYKCSKLYNP